MFFTVTMKSCTRKASERWSGGGGGKRVVTTPQPWHRSRLQTLSRWIRGEVSRRPGSPRRIRMVVCTERSCKGLVVPLDVVQPVAMPPDGVLQLVAVIISVAAPRCLQPQTFLDPQQAGGVPHFSFSPQGAQLVSRNPGVVNETLFGHPSSFTRKVPVGVVCRL